MRKIAITVIALMAVHYMQAQVYIQTTLPTVGMVQKNQLWNLVLINGATATMEGKLTLLLSNRQTGMEMLSATTSRFTLPKGSMPVNVNNLNPVQYNYTGMGPGASLNGLLPAGAYTACYSFIRLIDGKEEQLTEECVAFDIEPLSPPLLIFPADSSELEQSPAQFTWTPPTPAGMMNQLRYEILIAEIKPGQQPAEALQQNMSFYNTASLPNNFMTYPAALPAFEKDKWYSWQVVARDEKNYAGKSEVWVFKIKQPAAPKAPSQTYVTLSSSKSEFGNYTLAEHRIGIKYYSYDNNYTGVVRISNTSGKLVQTVNREIIYGENMFSIELKNAVKTGETYRLELTTANGQSKSFLFSIAASK